MDLTDYIILNPFKALFLLYVLRKYYAIPKTKLTTNRKPLRWNLKECSQHLVESMRRISDPTKY